jgi:hypothetical protein
MSDIRAGTISGFNEYINGLRADKDTEYKVTLVQFDAYGNASGPTLTITCEDVPLADVPVLTEKLYEPRGSTPLFDAIGECARRTGTVTDRGVTMVIITDGQENASKEFDLATIKSLIAAKEKEGWTFVFIGADIDAYSTGSLLGVSAAATVSYKKGLESQMYTNTARATMNRAADNRMYGVHASVKKSFYTVGQKQAMGDDTPDTDDPGTTGGGSSSSVTATAPPPVRSKRPQRNWDINTTGD